MIQDRVGIRVEKTFNMQIYYRKELIKVSFYLFTKFIPKIFINFTYFTIACISFKVFRFQQLNISHL